MKIIDWLHGLFRPPEQGLYRLDYRAEAERRVAFDAYALFTAVHLIASLLSVCEFRTYRTGRELHGAEWAALNVRPNKSQNAAEWKRELAARLLLAGEVLCIQQSDGQLVIADCFVREDLDAVRSRFTQVGRAGYSYNRAFLSDDVLYLQTPVNARAVWLGRVMDVYCKLMASAADRFQNADGERGILKISAVERGRQDFAQKFDALMNDYFKGYFASKNAVLPLFEGYEYTAQSGSKAGTYTNDLTAVKTLADEAIARAAQVFGIPPSYIRGDAAGISEAQSAALTNAVKPLAVMIGAELTGKKHTVREIARGSRIEVDTGNILHHDVIGSASGMDKLIGCGYTVNEVNRMLGQPASDDPLCDQRFITRNYQTMESAIAEENAADAEKNPANAG